jgi:hypothetical protein
MKRLLLSGVLLVFINKCFCQKTSPNTTQDCKDIISTLSKECKQNSTGNGGFRRENAKYILACKKPFTKVFLLQNLGKPNEIRKIYQGTEFLYYYYDARTLPKVKEGPLACGYVYF